MNSNYRLKYKYAVIDLETRQCYNILTASYEIIQPDYIPLEVFSFDYDGKYYIDGAWYEDAAGTIPWAPEE